MMNTHIINKQIIDLKIPSEENAFGLRQEARDAYMNNVLPLIGEVLDEFAGPGEVLRIDRLELDFGTISKGRMGQQMKERVREALLKQLPQLKEKKAGQQKEVFSIFETVQDGKRSKAQLMSESFSQRELLAIFFETGFLPWWSPDEIDAPDIDAIVVDLLDKEAVTTLQWLQQIALSSPSSIKRMVMQVEKATQKRILAAFPAKIIISLRQLAKQLQEVKTNAAYFPPGSTEGEALLFTALILPAEVLQQHFVSGNQSMLQQLIVQFAQVYAAPQAEVEKQIYAATLAEIIAAPAKKTAIPDLVAYFKEWEKTNPGIVSSVTGNDLPAMEMITGENGKSISELVDAIEEALKAFEEKQAFIQRSRKAPRTKPKVQLKNRKQQPKQEETGALENSVEVSRDKKSPGTQTNGIVEENEQADDLVSSSNEKEIDPLKEETGELAINDHQGSTVKINWFKTKDETATPEKLPGKIEAAKSEASASADQQETLPFKKEETGSEKQETKIVTTATGEIKTDAIKSEEKSIAEQVDEIVEDDFFTGDHPLLKKKPSAAMTRFGGIVLIAPFLPAFFSELKLVIDGKFTSETEQHKALHLLNYLASGKTSSPEYALLLHKLLCGIELTKPVPKMIKLSAAEKKEALLFLDDIAGQWTALRSTSGKAFRDTFFRRNGILEQKNNAWLLRVERGPMDIMLNTLPWTTSIIKAPWMQQLLQVEW
jgi:hypothetical protein